jgi:hypothetical protein
VSLWDIFRRKKMAKKDEKNDDRDATEWAVGYKLHGDGIPPAATPFGAVLRLPIEMRPADGPRELSLGVSFDVPVYVVPVLGQGVEAVLYGPVVMPGQPVCVRLGDRVDLPARAVVANVLFFAPPDKLVQI